LIFTFASIPIYYTLAIIFGAPFFSEGISTLEFSVVLSFLTTLPICLSTSAKQHLIAQLIFDLLPLDNFQFFALRVAGGAILGAWLGAFVIPLDWDRWWQVWPIPCIFGSVTGSTIGLVEGFLELSIFERKFPEKSKYF